MHYLNLLFLYLNNLKKEFLIKLILLRLFFNNWYTRETQPIDPFVLEGLPLFTIFPPEDRDHTDSRRINNYVIVMTLYSLLQ